MTYPRLPYSPPAPLPRGVWGVGSKASIAGCRIQRMSVENPQEFAAVVHAGPKPYSRALKVREHRKPGPKDLQTLPGLRWALVDLFRRARRGAVARAQGKSLGGTMLDPLDAQRVAAVALAACKVIEVEQFAERLDAIEAALAKSNLPSIRPFINTSRVA